MYSYQSNNNDCKAFGRAWMRSVFLKVHYNSMFLYYYHTFIESGENRGNKRERFDVMVLCGKYEYHTSVSSRFHTVRTRIDAQILQSTTFCTTNHLSSTRFSDGRYDQCYVHREDRRVKHKLEVSRSNVICCPYEFWRKLNKPKHNITSDHITKEPTTATVLFGLLLFASFLECQYETN